MNVRLLRRIQWQILKEPKRFDMDAYYCTETTWDIPNCGTAACIAGWTVALVKGINPHKAWISGIEAYSRSKKELKLTTEQAHRLFYSDEWPKRYFKPYSKALSKGNAKAAARIAVNRINHFIKTKGES